MKRNFLYFIIFSFLFCLVALILFGWEANADTWTFVYRGMQTNNYNSTATGWTASYHTKDIGNRYYYNSYSGSSIGSVQIYFNDVSIPSTVKYGYLTGYLYYIDNSSYGGAGKPTQVWLNTGNTRFSSCSVVPVSDVLQIDTTNSNTGVTSGQLSNSQSEGIYQYTCFLYGGVTYDNIEIVNDLQPNSSVNFDVGINLHASLSYILKDNDSTLANAIDNQTQELEKQTQVQEEMKNMDLPDESSESAANTDNINSFSEAEDSLKFRIGQTDLDNVNISFDNNSNLFVWDTMTSLFQSHPAIFSLVISILSVGIIKLMLAR